MAKRKIVPYLLRERIEPGPNSKPGSYEGWYHVEVDKYGKEISRYEIKKHPQPLPPGWHYY